MDRLEEQLRVALRESGTQAGSPRPLRRERFRRIRVLQTTYLVMVTALVAVAGVGLLAGLKIVTGPRQVVPAQESFTPQRLYVIDGAPSGLASEGAVLAVASDTTGANVVQRYPLGSDPDVAFSPDGSRLYGVGFVFLDNGQTPARLRVFDTDTGKLIQDVDVQDYPGNMGFHITQNIAVSLDSARVYVVVGFPTSPDRPLSLATYDVSSGSILPNVAPLSGCNSWPTILPRDGQRVVVVCPGSDDVRFLQVSNSGAIASEDRLFLPTKNATVTDGQGNVRDVSSVSGAVLSPDASTLYAVTADGLAFVVDVQAQRLTKTIRPQLPAGSLVALSQVKIAQDGSALFLGLDAGIDLLQARDIVVVDTTNWNERETIQTPAFSAFELASDESRVFTIDYAATALRQVAVDPAIDLPDLGKVAVKPQAIYVAP